MRESLDERYEKSVVQTDLKTIPSSGLLVLQSNPRRLSIVIQAPSSAQLQIRLGVQAAVGGFVSVVPGDYPLSLTLRDFGDLIRREIAISGTAADTFLFSEVLCSCG